MSSIPFFDCIDIVGTSVHDYEGSKLYISTGAVDTNKIDYNQVEEVTYQNRPSRANLVVQEGDVIFAKMQATNKTIYINKKLSRYIFSTGFFAVRAREGVITPSCLYLLLSSEQFLSQKDKYCSGATQKAITNSGLKKISISIPDISIQEKLSKILLMLQSSIVQHKTMMDKYDELIKSRFVEMFGDPKLNNYHHKIIPFGLVVEYMGDIGSNGANKVVVEHLDMKDEEDYALMVRFLNFTNNDFTNNVKYISKESYDFFKKSKLFGGELIICKIGSAGLNYVMPNLNRPVSLGLNQIMVRLKKEILMPYLYQYLHTEYGEFLISECVNGAVTKSITKTKLKELPLMLPPIHLQSKYADFVTKVEQQKATVQKSIDKLETLKKSLMQEYFG